MQYQNAMARQFNGPVIQSLLETRHNIYDEADAFIVHRQHLSIDNATEEELLLIGKFLAIPRPYAEIEGEIVYCDIPFYRLFLKNLMLLRTTKSLADFQQMLDQFMPDGLFFIEIQENGDIKLTIDEQYHDYEPFFQIAADSVYNSLPKLYPIVTWDFSDFVINHVLYARLVRIYDGSWYFSVENNVGVIDFTPEKGYVNNHVFYLTVEEN